MKKQLLLTQFLSVVLAFIAFTASATVPAGWTQVTQVGDLSDGDLIILVTNDGSNYMNGTVSKGHFQVDALSESAPASAEVAGVIRLHAIAGAENTYSMELVSTGKYVVATKAASGSGSVEGDSDSDGWKFTAGTTANCFDAQFQASGKLAYVRSFSNGSFRTYASKLQDEIQLYKYSASSSSSKSAANLAFNPSVIVCSVNDAIDDIVFTKDTDATVTFTSSDAEIAEYEDGTLLAYAHGVCTITATSEENENYKAGEATLKVGVANGTGAGTAANPYDVARALDVLALGVQSTENVHVLGFVSGIDEISTEYNNATYYISDDGTRTNELMIYRGKYVGDTAFTAETPLNVGDMVTVCGQLTMYGEISELAKNNYIVEREAVEIVSIAVTALPTKVAYYLGEELDLTGGKITVTDSSSNSTEMAMTAPGVTVTGFDSETVGTKTLTITYSEKSATFQVTVSARPECAITWSVNGVESTGNQQQGTALELPAEVEVPDGYTFMGWTTSATVASDGSEIVWIGETVPEQAEITYYAVFAKGQFNEVEKEIVLNSENVHSAYTTNNVDRDMKDIDGFKYYGCMSTNFSGTYYLQMRKSDTNGATSWIYNTTALNVSQIAISYNTTYQATVYFGSAENPTTGSCEASEVDGDYVYTNTNADNCYFRIANDSSNAIRIASITISYTEVVGEFSNYKTVVFEPEIVMNFIVTEPGVSGTLELSIPELPEANLYHRHTPKAAEVRAAKAPLEGFTQHTEAIAVSVGDVVEYYAEHNGKTSDIQTYTVTTSDVTGLENVTVGQGEAEYFDLTGRRVENPTAGIYIRRVGTTATKVLVK